MSRAAAFALLAGIALGAVLLTTAEDPRDPGVGISASAKAAEPTHAGPATPVSTEGAIPSGATPAVGARASVAVPGGADQAAIRAAADSLLSARVEGCAVCSRMAEEILPGEFFHDAHEFACAVCHHPHVRHSAEEWMRTCTSSGCHVRAWTETVMHRLDPEVFARCTNCHKPHIWTADGTDCLSCHAGIHGPEGTVPAPSVAGATEFPHDRHEDLACSHCHRSETRHAELVLRDQAACMDCHHGGGEGGGAIAPCSACHASGGRAGERPMRVTFQLSVWDTGRSRTVPFDHGKHNEIACATCHQTAEGPVRVDCGSCHEQHHRVGGPCLGCHEQPPPDVHDIEVHESRSCSDCHERNGFLAALEDDELSTTRDFCVVCHQDQVDHQAGRDCAGCHRLPVYRPGGGK